MRRIKRRLLIANENLIPKYNFAPWQLFREYSALFTLYNTGELSCNWMATTDFKVKIANKWVTALCSLWRQNLNFGNFTLFCGVRRINSRKFVAARAARLCLNFEPIIFLPCGVFTSVAVVFA